MGLPPKDALLDGTDDWATANSNIPSAKVLSTPVLDWWLHHESAISALRSTPNNYTLVDICFAPAGRGTPCVVQSISAWLGTDLSEWGEDWPSRIEECAGNPSACLPPFGQPIDPKLILGGAEGEYLNAKSLVITWVARAEEWERELERYLMGVERESAKEANVKIAFSTGVSLEQELNKVRRSVTVPGQR
jgi:Niemann-Pick C1 protein